MIKKKKEVLLMMITWINRRKYYKINYNKYMINMEKKRTTKKIV